MNNSKISLSHCFTVDKDIRQIAPKANIHATIARTEMLIPIKTGKHGRKAYSFFKYELNAIANIINNTTYQLFVNSINFCHLLSKKINYFCKVNLIKT
ncbi:MAG: hypothetical protein AUJ98_00195 [Bacteroidetes bacterium CG2_30_33_31]|nr:MAG: hypothetical protein AUJ98_00195 [Bacteroidetes bacterium CG2_30_33_31]